MSHIRECKTLHVCLWMPVEARRKWWRLYWNNWSRRASIWLDRLKLHDIHLAWHTQAAWHPSGLTCSSCMASIWLDTLKLHGSIWLDMLKLIDIHLAWHAQAAWHPFGLTCSSWLAFIWLDPVKLHGRTTQTRWNQQMTRRTGRDTLF